VKKFEECFIRAPEQDSKLKSLPERFGRLAQQRILEIKLFPSRSRVGNARAFSRTSSKSVTFGDAPFDVAGAGDGLTVGLVRHSQRKRGATDRPDLRGAAPVLDPTLGGAYREVGPYPVSGWHA
jgi:hypothetical protein